MVPELTTLQPDIVLGFGARTTAELRRVLTTLPGIRPRLIPCRFPSRIPSQATRPVTPATAPAWEKTRQLAEQITPPPPNPRHAWQMLKFPKYFLDLQAALKAE